MKLNYLNENIFYKSSHIYYAYTTKQTLLNITHIYFISILNKVYIIILNEMKIIIFIDN